MLREYICPRWPEYSIGAKVKFVGGWFRTEDPYLIKIVESNDWYRVFIWPADGEDNEAKAEAAETEGGLLSDPQSGGGISVALQDNGEAPRPGKKGRRIGNKQGRETSPVLQELEELVRGSGIISGQSQQE